MAESIIFLGAGTRRVFPVEIILSSDVAPVSTMCIVSSTSSICSVSVCWCCVLFADVAPGKFFADGTNGFVHALVGCCGAGTTFSDFLFCFWN